MIIITMFFLAQQRSCGCGILGLFVSKKFTKIALLGYFKDKGRFARDKIMCLDQTSYIIH